MQLAWLLGEIRYLPSRVAGHMPAADTKMPFFGMLSSGGTLVLLDDTLREVITGSAGQLHRVNQVPRRFATREAFDAFTGPEHENVTASPDAGGLLAAVTSTLVMVWAVAGVWRCDWATLATIDRIEIGTCNSRGEDAPSSRRRANPAGHRHADARRDDSTFAARRVALAGADGGRHPSRVVQLRLA